DQRLLPHRHPLHPFGRHPGLHLPVADVRRIKTAPKTTDGADLMARAFLRPPAAAAAGHAKKTPFQLTLKGRLLVRGKGFEPSRLPTRTSNVRVCQFRHPRITSRGAGLGAAGEL